MEDALTIRARCGAALGSISVQCGPDSTVEEMLDRLLRSHGASTSAPDVVRLASRVQQMTPMLLCIILIQYAGMIHYFGRHAGPELYLTVAGCLCAECNVQR